MILWVGCLISFIWYLLIGVTALIVSFIVHFALRALWIGILGLVSVYPDGIKYRTNLMSEDYFNKLIKRFPDINIFNKKLDNTCSTMFASTFHIFMLMISIAIWIIVSILVGYLLSKILPIDNEIISLTFFALSFIPTMLQGILSLKQLREKNWVKRIHFPINAFFSRIMYNVFYEPGSYILLTFTTHAKNSATSSIYAFSSMLLMMIFAVPFLWNSNVMHFMEDQFFAKRNSEFHIYAKAYEDQREDRKRILYPTIPSFDVSGNQLQVFMPSLNREDDAYYEIVPKWEDKEDISKEENRKLRRQYYLEGFHKFNKFYLNGNALDSLHTYYYTHTNKGETGKLTLIPSDDFKLGENLLKIEKAYYNEEGKPLEIFIRFNYEEE